MKFNALTVFRRTFIGLFALFVLLVCFILSVFFYNHYSDEELSPEAAAYFAKPIINLPLPDNNAAFSVFGMRGGAGTDIHALGLAYWDQSLNALRLQQPVAEIPDDLPIPDLPKCPKTQIRCFYWMEQHVDVTALARRYELLLERYRDLHAYPFLVSPNQGTLGSDAPLAIVHGDIRRLWELDVLRFWSEGKDERFLSEIASDTRFWIDSANNASLLIDKMLASSYIQKNYELLAEAALSHPQRFRKHTVEWQKFLSPLPASFFDMRGVMWGEHATLLSTLHNNFVRQPEFKYGTSGERPHLSLVISKMITSWLYQQNATKNQLYRRMLKIQEIQKKSPDQLIRLKDEEIFDQDLRGVHFHMLKNPLGKYMLGVADTDWSYFALNPHATDAKRRLVIIQSQLLQHEPTEYAQLIQNLPADLRNPQNGKPPRLDLKAHLLEFDWATREGESKPLRVGLP